MTIPAIVIAGQSNAGPHADAQGVANFAALGLTTPFPAVNFMQRYQDTPTDPLTWPTDRGPIALQTLTGGNQGLMGVEQSLGRRLTALGITHAIIQNAVGSSFLGGPTPHWQAVAGPFPSTPPSLFDQHLAYVASSAATMSATPVGVVWIQGEADSGNGAACTGYATNLISLITKYRLTYPNAWFLINQQNINAGGALTDLLRFNQNLVARSMPGVYVIANDALPTTGAHFVSQSYYDLGIMMADRIFDIMTGRPAIPTYNKSSLPGSFLGN